MPPLDPYRKEFLAYLRTDYPHGRGFQSRLREVAFPYGDIEGAIKHLAQTDPDLWRILYNWLVSRTQMGKFSEEMVWSTHSIRRKLNTCADILLCRLGLRDVAPESEPEPHTTDLLLSYNALKRGLFRTLEAHIPGFTRELQANLRREKRV